MINPGDMIGFLRVIRDTGDRVKSYKIWECECTRCGKVVSKSTEQLKTAISCGCYRQSRMSATGAEREKMFRRDNAKSGINNSLRGIPNKNNNSSGVRGVTWDTRRDRWYVQIMHNRKAYNLGRFQSLETAISVRRQAEDALKEGGFQEWYAAYTLSRRY